MATLQEVLTDFALLYDAEFNHSDQGLVSVDRADAIAELIAYGIQTFLGDGFMVNDCQIASCVRPYAHLVTPNFRFIACMWSGTTRDGHAFQFTAYS